MITHTHLQRLKLNSSSPLSVSSCPSLIMGLHSKCSRSPFTKTENFSHLRFSFPFSYYSHLAINSSQICLYKYILNPSTPPFPSCSEGESVGLLEPVSWGCEKSHPRTTGNGARLGAQCSPLLSPVRTQSNGGGKPQVTLALSREGNAAEPMLNFHVCTRALDIQQGESGGRLADIHGTDNLGLWRVFYETQIPSHSFYFKIFFPKSPLPQLLYHQSFSLVFSKSPRNQLANTLATTDESV